jgi:hypothetical protein
VKIPTGRRLGRRARWGLVALAVGLAAPLVIATRLDPDPRGYGTHEQLGLPRCGFFAATGRPCPSCGMTTAFAWSVRGHWGRAWGANPAGSVLAPLCVVLVAWLVACAGAGRALGARTIDGPLIAAVAAMVTLGLGAWLSRTILWRVWG